jgi:hypothetical protein
MHVLVSYNKQSKGAGGHEYFSRHRVHHINVGEGQTAWSEGVQHGRERRCLLSWRHPPGPQTHVVIQEAAVRRSVAQSAERESGHGRHK